MIEEMISNLSKMIKGQMGKADMAITDYKSGSIAQISPYKTLLEIYVEQELYLMESSDELEKAIANIIERQKIIEEQYASTRIGEGFIQMLGGMMSMATGMTLIAVTAGLATPIVLGAAVVGYCSILYGYSNTSEATQNLFYGFSGDGTSIAFNPIRDVYFASNPELYCKIGNTSTIISTIGTPIIDNTLIQGIPTKQVVKDMSKCMLSGVVGSRVSHTLADKYNWNPYLTMGIGIGLSGIIYRGIEVADGAIAKGRQISISKKDSARVVLRDEKERYSSFGDLMSPEDRERYECYWDYAKNDIAVEDRIRLSQ